MKNIYLLCFILCTFFNVIAQDLPKGFAPGELEQMSSYLQSREALGFTMPPGGKIRAMAEWEEVQALLISWQSYPAVLTEIVRHAQAECKVLITTLDSNSVKSTLISSGVPLTNVRFLHVPANSVWIRDYAGNTVYRNDVESMFLVDWIYNRPRPQDDVMPVAHANYFQIPLYQTTQFPYDLTHTGGNYMSDGFGNAFSEMLVMDENPNKTIAQVDSIMKWFMGITRYTKFTNLPYDNIHHLDMHMKLLNEETLLVGEFPTGISDGPQIEANLLYLLNNYNSVFGTPYKVVRIPMCPSASGGYPGAPYGNAYYRTYTNAKIVNKTVIVPTYFQQYDTTALRIYREAMPGYTIKGINCNQTISASGAIHCITQSIGVDNPLLIRHQNLSDFTTYHPYQVDAFVKHNNGIQNAKVFYRSDTLQPYQSVNMTLTNASQNIWTAHIPPQIGHMYMYYYIEATANNGKVQKRPITAPQGYFKFRIDVLATAQEESGITAIIDKVFPNPASAITCISMQLSENVMGSLKIYNVLGQEVLSIKEGIFENGKRNYFFDAAHLRAGTYNIVFRTEKALKSTRLLVK